MWWRRRRQEDEAHPPARQVVRPFARPVSLEEGRPKGEPLLVHEEDDPALPIAPTLLIGLGKVGVETLRRVKATLEVELRSACERVALMGIVLDEGHEKESDHWAPLTTDEVLTFAPRYTNIGREFPWWRPEFATAKDAERPRGRMLWFWDQTISGEQRITARIDALRTQLSLSAQDRLQVLIFGAVEAGEFAVAADMALWLRQHLMEQHLFNVSLFGLVTDERHVGARQVAALQELRRYIAAPQQWIEDNSGRPIVWEKFLFDHVFLLSEKDVATWALGEAKEVIYTALVDMAIAFLDPKAAAAMRETLSLIHRPAGFFSIGGIRTSLWKTVSGQGRISAEVLRRVVGDREETNSSGQHLRARQWVERFLTRRFGEVEGGSGFSFETLLQIERERTFQGTVALPSNFRDGFRWRVLLFLDDLMNEPGTSLGEGLSRAALFMDALFAWWARFRRIVKAPAARKWAGILVSESDGVLEDIQKVKEKVGEWQKLWRQIEQSLEGQEKDRLSIRLATPKVKVRRYFGDGGRLAEVQLEVSEALRERLKWQWQEVRSGEPELILATLVRRPELWSVRRVSDFVACISEEAARIMEQRIWQHSKDLSIKDLSKLPVVMDNRPLESFLDYRLTRKSASALLFVPEKLKNALFSQSATRPTTILGWGLAARIMRVVLEGGITPESLLFWQENTERFVPTPAQYVFVQEQRWATLRRYLIGAPWSAWFVNLLASEEIVRAMGIAFWYGWVQLKQETVTGTIRCLLVSPSGEALEQVEVESPGGWKEAFTQAARGWWLDDFQWGQWARKLHDALPIWLEGAHASSWEERQTLFQKREPAFEALGKQGEDGRALQAYLRFLREEEQWA